MKKLLYIIIALACSTAITSCKFLKEKLNKDKDEVNEEVVEDPNSKAAKSLWDYHLIGSWLYSQQDTTKDFSKGVETFLGTGEYVNHTEDSKGNRNVLTGTWQVDNKEDYTIDINITSIKTADGEKEVDKNLKYTIVAIEPGAMLTYDMDGTTRIAACVE